LDAIFPKLLEGASQQIQFSFEDANEEDVEGEVTKDDETGLESAVISLGGGMKKRVTLHTHSLQQKSFAMKVLFELSSSLGSSLGNFLLPAMECIMKSIGEKYSTEVRYSAASALPILFKSIVNRIKEQQQLPTGVDLRKIFHESILMLMDCIKLEPDHATKLVQIEGLRDLLDVLYSTGNEEMDGNHLHGFLFQLDESFQKTFVQFLLLQCAEVIVDRNNIGENLAKNEALEEEDKMIQMEDAMEQCDSLLTVLIDNIGHLIKLGQSSPFIMTLIDQMIAPAFSAYLSPDQPLSLQRMVCCLMDDVIEFGGAASHKYLPSLIPIFLMNTQNEEDFVLRQCSMYGLCMICYKAAEVLVNTPIPSGNGGSGVAGKTFIGPLLSCFATAVLDAKANEEDYQGTTENALFGLLNLIGNPLYHPEIGCYANDFPIYKIYSLVLSKLPLKLDSVEIKISMNILVSMVKRNDTLLFTKDSSTGEFYFLKDLLRVFGEILALYYSTSQSATEQSPASIATMGNMDEDEENGLKGKKLLHEMTKNDMETILKNFQNCQMIKTHQIQDFSLNAQTILKTYSS
jgi:hypothetical protein